MVNKTGVNGKMKKQSKMITLRLAPSMLSQFIAKPTTSSSDASTPMDEPEESTPKPAISIENASDSNSTPAPGQDASMSDGSKKRKTPGSVPKKLVPSAIDTMPKPRGKPGPKKKPRLEDGTIDHGLKPAIVAAAAANHKLGPKANTGAINAGLRALDRTGTPCRKWARNGFQLKSFTGVVWQLSTWKSGETSGLSKAKEGESTNDTRDVSGQSSSDVKPNGSDVDMSNAGDTTEPLGLVTPAASSPAPMSMSATVTAQG